MESLSESRNDVTAGPKTEALEARGWEYDLHGSTEGNVAISRSKYIAYGPTTLVSSSSCAATAGASSCAATAAASYAAARAVDRTLGNSYAEPSLNNPSSQATVI